MLYVFFTKLYDLKNILFKCKLCGEQVFGKQELENHLKKKHPHEVKPNEVEYVLDWLVVIPRIDHLRYNEVKSMISLLWDVYFQSIAIQLGYSSPKAQQVVKVCSDFHQADQMVAALMELGSQTLVKLYSDSVDGVERSPEACL